MKRKNNIFRRTTIWSAVFIWLAAALLLAGCSKEQSLSVPDGDGALEVRLVIDTKQAQTRITDVNIINTLRVYIFDVATNELVGYKLHGSLQESGFLPTIFRCAWRREETGVFCTRNEETGLLTVVAKMLNLWMSIFHTMLCTL